jgi:hypothetical protein
MTSRILASMLCLAMFLGAVGDDHIDGSLDEIPVIIILAQEGPSLYDPYASEDDDYPKTVPVRLPRGNGSGKWASVLKTSSGTVSTENTHRLYLDGAAPSQQSSYHRQKVLRI